MAGAYDPPANETQPAAEADLRAIGKALWRKKALIVAPTLLAAAAALFIAGSMDPKFRSEAQVLVERNDSIYTRPEGVQPSLLNEVDEFEVASQVQLLLSRDLARRVVSDLKLGEIAEFDPARNGVSLPKRVLILMGLARDPLRLSAEERVLDAYYNKLNVYSVPKSRVIVVEFSSGDPETAANVANAVTERYIELQQTTKQQTTRRASTWLSSQIQDLSKLVAEAEAKVEAFRSESNLFVGTNNTFITTQQLGDLSTELSRVRGQQADARAKAQLIRDALSAGKPVESLDIANSELLRRLAEQRVALASTIAREGRTYLPGHPRMRELQAQQVSLDSEIKAEGLKLSRAYESEADLAGSRVASLQSTIDSQREVAGTSGGQEVQLRALEREAKAQRDLLEQFLARYRDAEARERVEAIPPDARIISRATPDNTPYSPKPLAITTLTAVAVLVLLIVIITATEFMVVPTVGGGTPLVAPAGPQRKDSDDVAVDATPLPEPRPQMPIPAAAVAVTSIQPKPVVAPAPASAPVAGEPVAFGRLNTAPPGAAPAEVMDIEAADMRMIGDLASHLAAMPKGEGALNIMAVAASTAVDPGTVALALARALAGAGRKAVVTDAGALSADFTAALPNPSEVGVGDLIAGKASFGQALQRDRASAVHLIAAGSPSLLAGDALTRMGIVLDALAQTYDFVIALAPPSDRSTDVATLARRMGAAILVADKQDAVMNAVHRSLLTAGIGDVILLLADAVPARPVERASQSA